MKVSDKEREWINSRLIYEVKTSEERSNIQLAAHALADESDDPENSFWLLVHHFIDPKNKKDLTKTLKKIDPVSVIENSTLFEKPKPKKKRSGGKRTKK